MGQKALQNKQFDGKNWDCKGFLQSFLSHGKKSFAKNQFDGKNRCCKGNFFQIVYLVNHIEIKFDNLHIGSNVIFAISGALILFSLVNFSHKKLQRFIKINIQCFLNVLKLIMGQNWFHVKSELQKKHLMRHITEECNFEKARKKVFFHAVQNTSSPYQHI